MHGAFAYRAVAAVLAIGISTAPCAAQEYPTRSITLVVGFAAGGFADGVARMLGSKLSERLGQNIIVENRSGAGGNIAAAMVTKAPADGYTLLVTTTGFAINETLSKDKGFSLGDLKPITIPAWAPETLNVPAKSEAKSLTELMRMAKTKPVTFGSPGVGTSGHIANAYMFKNLAKVDAVHVPFQGGAPALNAGLGGHVDVLVGAIPGYAGSLKSGLIRGLALGAEKRLAHSRKSRHTGRAGFPRSWRPRGLAFLLLPRLVTLWSRN